jgi:hypothetical protein
MRHRKDETMSKPGNSSGPGTSKVGTYLLALRHLVYRWHELNTGFCTERENLSPLYKGKTSSRCTGKRKSTDGLHGSGTSRTSEEIPVMRMERRGCINRLSISGAKLSDREVAKDEGKTRKA